MTGAGSSRVRGCGGDESAHTEIAAMNLLNVCSVRFDFHAMKNIGLISMQS
jgi:hypothetical protein